MADGVTTINNLLRIVGQSIGIIGVVLALIYYPVNAQHKAVIAEISNAKAETTKECQRLSEFIKEDREAMKLKVSAETLEIHLKAITMQIEDMKLNFKETRNEILAILSAKNNINNSKTELDKFKSEILSILKNSHSYHD